MNGFISLHRQFIDWEWYQDNNTKALFIHCLLMANWKNKRWQGKVIKRGSFVTSQEKLAQQLNLSRSAIRVAIAKLKKTGEIQTYGQLHTVVTVCKYDSYQDKENNRSQSVANESPMNSQSVANEWPLLNKEIKKQSNNDLDGFEIVWDHYNKKVKKEPARKKWLKLKEKDREAIKAHVPNFVKANPEKKYRPDFITYLNQKRWMDEDMPVNGHEVVYDDEYKQREFKYLNQ